MKIHGKSHFKYKRVHRIARQRKILLRLDYLRRHIVKHHEKAGLLQVHVGIDGRDGIVSDLFFPLIIKLQQCRLIPRGKIFGVVMSIYTQLQCELIHNFRFQVHVGIEAEHGYRDHRLIARGLIDHLIIPVEDAKMQILFHTGCQHLYAAILLLNLLILIEINIILQIFNARHPTGNAMDGLQRLLNSYAKPDGTIIPRDLITCLNDVMIDISMEQATKICREVGMSMKGFTLVSALMGYLEMELQQLRGKHDAPAARTTGRSPSPSGGMGTLPVLNKSASVQALEGNAMSKVDDQTLEGTMQGILQIFAARHDRKNAGGNALDSLQRLLSSYAKPDGTVVPKDLVVALADLMIDINVEQANLIVHEAGANSKGTVMVTYLMAYLNKDMRAMSPPRRRMSTLRVSGEFQPVEVSHDDTHAGAEAAKERVIIIFSSNLCERSMD